MRMLISMKVEMGTIFQMILIKFDYDTLRNIGVEIKAQFLLQYFEMSCLYSNLSMNEVFNDSNMYDEW